MKKELQLTLGHKPVIVKVDVNPPPPPREPLTPEEVRELNENWDRVHWQMSLD